MSRTAAQVIVIIESVLFGGSGVVCMPVAPMAFMGFDKPGSETDPFIWLLVLTMVSYPVVCIAGVVCAWLLFRANRYTWACLVGALPIVNVLILFACFLPELAK